jgi:hypothetical protein
MSLLECPASFLAGKKKKKDWLSVTSPRDIIPVAPRILHDRENHATDCEVKEQTPIFLEEAVSHRGGQVRHEKVVDRVPGQYRYQRIEEVFHLRSIPLAACSLLVSFAPTLLRSLTP